MNAVVDELAKDKNIAALYDLWYEQRDKITGTYRNTPEQRIPLSQNKEFKAIKNAVIQEGVLCQPGKNHAGYRQPVPTGQKAEDGSKQRWYESDRTAAESPHTNPHRLGGGCHAIFHKAVSDRSATSCQARLYLSPRPDGQ